MARWKYIETGNKRRVTTQGAMQMQRRTTARAAMDGSDRRTVYYSVGRTIIYCKIRFFSFFHGLGPRLLKFFLQNKNNNTFIYI
jgi:hypothetical protein